MKKAVLFDFWGTIVQQGAYSPLKQTYRLMRPRMRFSDFVERFERVTMTRPYDDQVEMFRAACEALDVPVRAWIVEKLVGVWNKNKLLAAPYPETLEVLQQLKDRGIRIAIVSNTPKLSVDGILEKFGFDKLFDAVCFSYDVGFLKTDPQLFDAAMEKLGVAKDEVVMVGDSLETDIAGAEKAGVTPVLIDRRNSREYKNRIVSLKEIDKFL